MKASVSNYETEWVVYISNLKNNKWKMCSFVPSKSQTITFCNLSLPTSGALALSCFHEKSSHLALV